MRRRSKIMCFIVHLTRYYYICVFLCMLRIFAGFFYFCSYASKRKSHTYSLSHRQCMWYCMCMIHELYIYCMPFTRCGASKWTLKLGTPAWVKYASSVNICGLVVLCWTMPASDFATHENGIPRARTSVWWEWGWWAHSPSVGGIGICVWVRVCLLHSRITANFAGSEEWCAYFTIKLYTKMLIYKSIYYILILIEVACYFLFSRKYSN